MALIHSPVPVSDSLIGSFDPANPRSFRGEVTTNMISSTPLSLSVYAYASGPEVIANQYDAILVKRNINRYTITSAVNTARAMIIPTGLAAGTFYTFSCIWRYNGGNASVTTLSISAAKGFPEGGANNNTMASETTTNTAIGNGWIRSVYTFSFSANPTGAAILTYGIATGSDSTYIGKTFDVYNEQLEVSSYATTYVVSSRGRNASLGGGLLNLAANANHGILHGGVKESTNNSGLAVFDGINDYIGLASSTKAYHWTASGIGNNNFTVEVWVKLNDTEGYIFSRPWNGSGEYNYYVYGSGVVISSGGQGHQLATSAFPTATWMQIGMVLTPTTVALYRNGALWGGPSNHGLSLNTPTYGDADLPLVLMSLYPYNFDDSTPWSGLTSFSIGGDVGPVRIYGRALTATEIRQNFHATRSRYGI